MEPSICKQNSQNRTAVDCAITQHHGLKLYLPYLVNLFCIVLEFRILKYLTDSYDYCIVKIKIQNNTKAIQYQHQRLPPGPWGEVVLEND